MTATDSPWDLLWFGLATLYVYGLIVRLDHLFNHPTDRHGQPWADTPLQTFVTAVILLGWPALFLSRRYRKTKQR